MAKKSRCAIRGHNMKTALIAIERWPFKMDVKYCTRCRVISMRGYRKGGPPKIDEYKVIDWNSDEE